MILCMSKVILIALLLMSLPVTVSAADKWTTLDTSLQVAYSGVLITDWVQTLHATRDRNNHFENGFAGNFIGKYPTKRNVNYYFSSILIGNAAISYLLPKPYRTIWQTINIFIEYNVVQSNRRHGIGVKFYF